MSVMFVAGFTTKRGHQIGGGGGGGEGGRGRAAAHALRASARQGARLLEEYLGTWVVDAAWGTQCVL